MSGEAVGQAFILTLTLLAAGLTAGAYLLYILRWWSEGIISGIEFFGITFVFGLLFLLSLGSRDASTRNLSTILLLSGSLLLVLAPTLFSGASQKKLTDSREATYRAVIESNPGNAAARGELAKLLYGLNRWDEAIDEMDRAVQISPKTTDNERRLLERWRAERESRPREIAICRQCREETPRDEPRCIHCGYPLNAALEVTEYVSGSVPEILRSMTIAIPAILVIGFLVTRPGPFGLLFGGIIATGFAWRWLLHKD